MKHMAVIYMTQIFKYVPYVGQINPFTAPACEIYRMECEHMHAYKTVYLMVR